MSKTPPEKNRLHKRNRHRLQYDFEMLIARTPGLAPFVSVNKYNNKSVDFADPEAVKTLNKALLRSFYGIDCWDIPKGYLCPPVPGRADYIHYAADLLASSNNNLIPEGQKIKCLDIGVGANCIYPIIATHEYNWSVVGSDIDPLAARSARKIVDANLLLRENAEVRLQMDRSSIFSDIIKENECFDISICNPPFHSSPDEAREGSTRKSYNLRTKKGDRLVLNFGGQSNELWCEGGERRFIARMIRESAQIPSKVFWFTTLVSKSSNLPAIYKELEKVAAAEIITIEMSQGNKISRMVAWTFLNEAQQKEWQFLRWS